MLLLPAVTETTLFPASSVTWPPPPAYTLVSDFLISPAGWVYPSISIYWLPDCLLCSRLSSPAFCSASMITGLPAGPLPHLWTHISLLFAGLIFDRDSRVFTFLPVSESCVWLQTCFSTQPLQKSRESWIYGVHTAMLADQTMLTLNTKSSWGWVTCHIRFYTKLCFVIISIIFQADMSNICWFHLLVRVCFWKLWWEIFWHFLDKQINWLIM